MSTGLLRLTSLVEETKREEQVNLREADDLQRLLSGIKKQDKRAGRKILYPLKKSFHS